MMLLSVEEALWVLKAAVHTDLLSERTLAVEELPVGRPARKGHWWHGGSGLCLLASTQSIL